MTGRRFSGHVGNELFEGTIEEWACRTGGTVTGPNTISIDLNKPTPFGKPVKLETRFGSNGLPDLYTVRAGHRPGKRLRRAVCAGALRHPIATRGER